MDLSLFEVIRITFLNALEHHIEKNRRKAFPTPRFSTNPIEEIWNAQNNQMQFDCWHTHGISCGKKQCYRIQFSSKWNMIYSHTINIAKWANRNRSFYMERWPIKWFQQIKWSALKRFSYPPFCLLLYFVLFFLHFPHLFFTFPPSHWNSNSVEYSKCLPKLFGSSWKCPIEISLK